MPSHPSAQSSALLCATLIVLLLVSSSFFIFSNQVPRNRSIAKLASSSQRIDFPISEIPVPQNSSEPLAIVMDSSGNVWFAESYTQQIVEYIPSSGTFHNYSIPTQKNSGLIWFILFDNYGNMWFSNAAEPLLWRFSPSTGEFANFSTGAELVDPYALIYDSSTNRIWFTSTYTGQIGVFQVYSNGTASLLKLISVPDPGGSIQTGSSGPIIGPAGLAMDNNGDLFVSETFASAIAEYNPSSSDFARIWELSAGSEPVGVAVDDSLGRVWFTNHATSNFGYIAESSGQIVQISSSLFSFTNQGYSDTISLPYWIQIAPSGMVWFDEHYGNKIARFDPTKMVLTEFLVPTNASSPLRFALDESRGLVWFTEFSGNNIGVLSQNDSLDSSILVSPGTVSLSGNPISLTLDSDQGSFSPLVSGSLSNNGNLASNLTVSSENTNSTAFKITIGRGAQLGSGNYTLTLCPRLSSNDSESNPPPTRQCAVTFLSIGSQSFLGLDQIELFAVGAIVIAVVAFVSLIYVRRWRTP